MFDADLSALSPAEQLSALGEFRLGRDHAEVRILEGILAFADRHPQARPSTAPGVGRGDLGDSVVGLPGMEQLKVYGGEGCPQVGDFVVADLGVVLKMSSAAAAGMLSDALGLRHRLPRVWARVLAGEARAWRACRIARASAALSLEAVADVDAAVEKIIDRVGPDRLKSIVDAAMWRADPDRAQAHAEEMARARGVWVGRSDSMGTNTLFVRAATGDVIQVDATIQALADALKILGDTDSVDRRRAKAIGWLAEPADAIRLLKAARYLATQQSRPADDACTTTTRRRTPDPAPTPATPSPAPTPATRTAELVGDLEMVAQEDGRDGGESWQLAADGWDQAYVPDSDQRGLDEPPPVEEPPPPDALLPGEYPPPRLLGDGLPEADGADVDARWDGDDFRWGSLSARLADIKDSASTGEVLRGGVGSARVVNVHLSAETLAALVQAGRSAGAGGAGVMRVEGVGPVLASQLREVLGHDKVVLKPVIDLRERVSVDACEIPARIRERVLLRDLYCVFPWCTRRATRSMDLDHVVPYDEDGPPGQTNTANLAPCCRYHHRLKTHGAWSYVVLTEGTYEWTSPEGARFLVDHTGTRASDEAAATRWAHAVPISVGSAVSLDWVDRALADWFGMLRAEDTRQRLR